MRDSAPRILILHASFGAGHKRAASALAEAFRVHGVEPEVHDLLEFLPPGMARFYSWAYEFMITRSRGLWHLTYELVNYPKKLYSPGKAITQRWQFQRLKEFIRKENFSDVISTHFTPSALFADWISSNELHARAYSVVTDHEAHRCWKRAGLHHYFVATNFVEEELLACGIPRDHISVTGIPVSLAFSSDHSRESSRSIFNLPRDSIVVLALCSALTSRDSLHMLRQFAQIKKPVNFLVSAGKDQERERYLKEAFKNDSRFNVFGFSNQIAQMMKAADLIVTKPGGLIISEALAIGIPQILLDPIPGQEEANARYAEKIGAAMRIREGCYLQTLEDAIGNRERLMQMSKAAKLAGKPEAAKQIAQTILEQFVV
jgi:processive 1,2-diacylglycerol beta-glucosyltransferase